MSGLPVERSNRLSDGEGHARRHPIKMEIEIDYADYKGEITTRTVGARSVLVTSQQGNFYLFGYCHLRADERCFRIDRIVRIRTDGLQLSQRFAIRAFFTS
jgi:predicted DNA-binding transcriptional regulator YafY